MFFKAIFPGKYIQGAGVLAQLVNCMRWFGKKGLILASGSAKNNILAPYADVLQAQEVAVVGFGKECCQAEVERLNLAITREKADVLVGMGGGKAIDTAKIAADRAGIPVIIVPTIASTDAPCSGCAILYSEEGVFEKVYYQKTNPQAVLVDSQVIANAPARFLISGMGDALATWFEARSCERTKSANACGGLSTMAGQNLARLCYDTLLMRGQDAKTAVERRIVTPALEQVIEANILLSGVGFESGGLGAAHAIHNGLTALSGTHNYYHGEKVAFGVLAGLTLTDARPDEMEDVYLFCENIGLPTTLADIGLPDVSRPELLKAARKACEPEESIHHEAGEMTPEKVLSAMLAADALGQARKEKNLARRTH